MASGRQRSRRRRRGGNQAPATGIGSLSDDILLEIFVRLPSLATLVRAALTCRAWRSAVASSPSFRRRFRALRPAPLLGVFTYLHASAPLPVFAPTYCRDRDVLAAVRSGDFFLTSLLDGSWHVDCCHDGYLVLANTQSAQLAMVNPLARYSPDYIVLPDMGAGTPEILFLGMFLLSSEEDPMSFRVLWVCYDACRVRAAVFSSDTWDWRVHPWEGVPDRTLPHDGDKYWLRSGNLVDGTVYWLCENMEYLLTLDTETMEFSVSELPPCLKGRPHCSVIIGGTKGGAPRIVYDTGNDIIQVLMPGGDEKGIDGWELDRVYHKDDPGMFYMVASKDGFVYLASVEMLYSLCLETLHLEKLAPRTFGANYISSSYFMAWPPSLVGNYGRFAVLEDDPCNA
jgi:hypothetical protein